MVKFLIDRPIAVTVSLIAFIVMSMVAAGLLPVSLMPRIDIPEIVVTMSVPDKPAREMEEQFVSKVRRQLLQVSHLSDIESTAANGQGNIRLIFDYGTNINYAFIEVNEKIDALMHTLPPEFTRPGVVKTSATDIPVFYLNISLIDSTDQEQFMQLSEFCEQVIKKRVEQLPEVAMADISGLEYPEIVLQVDMDRLSTLGVDRSTFSRALENNNYSVGNIKVRSGLYEFNVRYASLLKNRADIENVLIELDGRIFRLKELAEITIRPGQDKGIYLADNNRSVTMAVIKKSNARMASLKEKTAELVEQLRADYPRLHITIDRNQTELLDYSLKNLKSGLLLGGVLAFLIMFLFLKDLKSPLLIGISVPVSLAISLLFFYLLNITINIISLSGLILGVGMMIDNSIIVIDNIIQHRQTTNHEPQTTNNELLSLACINGTNEVIRPLISSVLTTCAVFVPLIFLSGISGALFYDQAMAVTIGLGVSLLVSVTLIPVYFRLLYRKSKNHSRVDTSKGKSSSDALGKKSSNSTLAGSRKKRIWNRIHIYSHIEDSYSRGFDFVLRNHIAVFSFAVLLLIAGFFIFQTIEKERFPPFKQTEALITIDWNKNITVAENHRRLDAFLTSCDSLTEHSSCMIGEQDFLLDATNRQGSSIAQLFIRANSESDLTLITDRFKDFCRAGYPEALITIAPPPNLFEKVFGSGAEPLEIRLKNRNREQLPHPETIREITSQVGGITGMETSTRLQLQNYFLIAPDYERMLIYSVSVDELVSALKKSFNRLQLFTLKQGQYQVPVFLSGNDEPIHQIIQSTLVRGTNRQSVPLSSLVSIREDVDYKILKGSKSDIYIALGYQASAKSSRQIIDAYETVLESYPHLEMEVRGSLTENVNLFREMSIVLLVSLLLLYFILAAQFESLLQPLIVLIEIPIDIAGALILLWLTGNSVNLMAFIGIIVMSGIIINDSILKIDTINRLVKADLPIIDAIHLGGKRRLKPIIMTSATTMLAMIPLLFGNDMGSRLQQPLALTVIGGMFIGTLVSLYIIPICYYYLKKIQKRALTQR